MHTYMHGWYLGIEFEMGGSHCWDSSFRVFELTSMWTLRSQAQHSGSLTCGEGSFCCFFLDLGLFFCGFASCSGLYKAKDLAFRPESSGLWTAEPNLERWSAAAAAALVGRNEDEGFVDEALKFT